MSRSGSAKCVIAPQLFGATKIGASLDVQSLYIWVLNPNVVYASSFLESRGSNTAMKLFYRQVEVEEGNKIVDALDSDVQEVTMPTTAVEAAIVALNASNQLLPDKDRRFKDWTVGLLHRWES
jgi:ubiquitin-protein ligase E3 D